MVKQLELPAHLAKAIRQWRSDLTKGIHLNIRKYIRNTYDIYRHYFDPFRSHLGGIKQLIVIPDQRLAQLPFGTLAVDTLRNDRKRYPFLRKEFLFSYAHSLKTYTLIRQLECAFSERSKVAAFAYQRGSTRGQSSAIGQRKATDLPASGRVLDLLSREFSDCQLFYNSNSTRGRFTQLGQAQQDIVHLGLHAKSTNESRHGNKIFFSASNLEDTIVGYEIVPLRLQANLVVLAACQSAAGMMRPGEGSYSLTRALFQSGVKNVVASLWNIEDEPTAAIFEYFYQHLLQGATPAEALHRAQSDFLKTVNRQFYNNPTFWGLLVAYEG
ncbi:MAG: CHAT domain-containing protein [Bacteroidota bacterium]